MQRRPQLAIAALLFAALCSTAGADAYEFGLETVESQDQVGEYLWLVLDDAGWPRMSYYKRTGGQLRYAWKDETGWQDIPVDGSGSENVGRYTAMCLDADQQPHISYFDDDNVDLKHAWRDGDGWHAETVDAVGNVGRYSTIRFEPPSTFHIVYHDEGKGDVKYAVGGPGAWTISVVDSVGIVGVKARMSLDEAYRPHAAYYDATNGALRIAWLEEGGWQMETIDSGDGQDVGNYASIVLAGSTRHISYYNATTTNPEYIRGEPGNWNHSIIEHSPGDSGRFTSIQLDGQGRPVVAFYDFSLGQLKLARRNGSWDVQIVDGGAPLDVGTHAALLLDSGDAAHVGYYNLTRQSLVYGLGSPTVPVRSISFGELRRMFGTDD